MVQSTMIRAGVCVLMIFGAGLAHAYDGNPPVSRTGAIAIGGKPAENLCTGCHSGNAVNSGGAVELLGLPSAYNPGTTYDLTVRVSSTQTSANTSRRWGFELTAVEAINGNGTGTLANIAGQGTSTAMGSGDFATRTYIRFSTNDHTAEASPVEWQVRWTAPDPATGPVYFMYCGMAANGASGSNGDWVYTANTALPPISTAVQPTTWGAVKSLFRS